MASLPPPLPPLRLQVVNFLNSFLHRAYPHTSSRSSLSALPPPCNATTSTAAEGRQSMQPAAPLLAGRSAWAPASAAACSVFASTTTRTSALPSFASSASPQNQPGSSHESPGPGPGAKRARQDAGATPPGGCGSGVGGSGGSTGTAALSGSKDALHCMCMALLHQMFTCWMECSPDTLSSSPELQASQTLAATLSATHVLMTHVMMQEGGGLAPPRPT